MPPKLKSDSTRTPSSLDCDSLDMFGVWKQAAPTSSPFFRVIPSTKKTVAPFPTLLMSNGFDRSAARNDAILTLRLTANQALRASAPNAFLEAVGREIALKRGDFDSETMMRDALMDRFLGKFKSV